MTYPAKPQSTQDAPCTSHGRLNCKSCRRGIPAVDRGRLKTAIGQLVAIPKESIPMPTPIPRPTPATILIRADPPAAVGRCPHGVRVSGAHAETCPPCDAARTTTEDGPGQAEGISDDVLRLLDLSGAPARVLRAVHARQGIRPDELSVAAEVPKTSLPPAVAVLVARGFIRVELKPRAGPPAKGRASLERAYSLDAQALRAALLEVASQVRDALATIPA